MLYKGDVNGLMLLNKSLMLFWTHYEGPKMFEEFRRISQTVGDI
jgi:hypothetical protein